MAVPNSVLCFGICILGLAIRLILIPANLYRSTDFEVHRNWLAITHSLPISRWYYEETSQWTLDYPPLFAYFEWFLSQFAALIDPDMLRVDNLEYASIATVMFQRVTVIAGDLVLFTGAYSAGSSAGGPNAGLMAIALVMLNPALLIVDHIHFQYNGMLLGLLLLSAADIQQGRVYRGSILFCALLNMKQIFLYVAPVYFVYLLRSHCGCAFEGKVPSLRWGALVRLGATVIACFGICWAPLLATGQVAQAASRLFPFGRGLTHAYWAPNVWALYNTADRVLSKLGLGSQQGPSSTAGFAEVYESSVLWTVPPKATFVLTALAYVPLLVVIWRSAPLPPRTSTTIEGKSEFLAGSVPGRARGSFLIYVALGCAVSFTFGWHVHEKAILMVTVPLLVAAADSGNSRHFVAATAVLSLIGTFSVLPLMPRRPVETMLKWVLLATAHCLEIGILHASQRSSGVADRDSSALGLLSIGPLPGIILVLLLAILGFYCDFGGHERIFGPHRMEFLPLMLMSDISTAFVLWAFVRIFRLVAICGHTVPQRQHAGDK